MTNDLLNELGGGLRLRRATPADVPKLLDLHAEAFGTGPHAPPSVADEHQLRDLLERPHPTFSGTEMTVVEEIASGQLVSSQHLSHHTWAYGGVPFSVGEIEHVSTRPGFRRRGLVKLQTDRMHRWSAEAGELVTVVNGIPWYYTQFGYDLPIDKYNGCRLIGDHARRIAPADAPYALRPAAAGDVDAIHHIYAHSTRRLRVSYVRTREHWAYDLHGRDARNAWHRPLYVLLDSERTVGFCSLNPTTQAIDAFEVAEGVPWSTATFSLARWLLTHPGADPPGTGGVAAHNWRFDWLGEAHPAFRACTELFGRPETLGTPLRRGAWYVRVRDLAAFVSTIVPALETALAASDEAGYTGTLSIGRYRDTGLKLDIDKGRIEVRPWRQTGLHDGDARFADGTFLELLFGRVDLESLEASHPYRVSVAPRARPVLRALFPKGPSLLLPVY